MKTITPLKNWCRAATPPERQALADKIGTSVPMLTSQYAGGHREVSATRAGQIEDATRTMHKASKGRLPIVTRTDVCQACRECPYARKALGERALVSDFPIIDSAQLDLPLPTPEKG